MGYFQLKLVREADRWHRDVSVQFGESSKNIFRTAWRMDFRIAQLLAWIA
jgi:hypothetical protein